MNTVVIEHVSLDELPAAWRTQLNLAQDARVTIRIDPEAETQAILPNNPLFGMWQDREEIADVQAFVSRLRAPRWDVDGSRSKE
jgi:hypothetical protein